MSVPPAFVCAALLALAGACAAPGAERAGAGEEKRMVVLQHADPEETARLLRASAPPGAVVEVLGVPGVPALLLQGSEQAVAALEREARRLDRP